MSGSQGSLTSVELRRHERTRGPDGTQTAIAGGGEIIDYTHGGVAPKVTIDGPTRVQLTSHAPDVITPRPSAKRTRTRTRPPRPIAAITDQRDEAQVVKSQVEGLIERVSYLEAALGHFSQELYEIRQSGALTHKDAS